MNHDDSIASQAITNVRACKSIRHTFEGRSARVGSYRQLVLDLES